MKTNLSQEGAATPFKKDRFDKKKVNVKVNSFINFQIGLIAVLLFAFLIVELTSTEVEVKKNIVAIIDAPNDDDWNNVIYKVVPNHPLQKKEIAKPQKDIPPKVVDDTTPDLEPDPIPDKPVDLVTTITDGEPVDSKAVDESTTTKSDNNSNATKSTTPAGPIITTFDGVDSMPLFPGCESLEDNNERRDCFNEKMKRFVQRKFDKSLANQLDIAPGKMVKIDILFTINEQGLPQDVKVRAPHKVLEKEAYRLIGKLPRITPGKIKGNPVSVYFALPIRFRVVN